MARTQVQPGWPSTPITSIANLEVHVANDNLRIQYPSGGSSHVFLLRVGESRAIQVKPLTHGNTDNEGYVQRWCDKHQLTYADGRPFYSTFHWSLMQFETNPKQALLPFEANALRNHLVENDTYQRNDCIKHVYRNEAACILLEFWLAENPRAADLLNTTAPVLTARLNLEEIRALDVIAANPIQALAAQGRNHLRTLARIWSRHLPDYRAEPSTLAVLL